MSSNLVIVALPAQDDPVWKVSSEKKPHLTLLFLGDSADKNVERIVEFVDHAVQVCEHGSFWMDVDYRDTLGPDEADVFLFRKDWSAKWITQFRNQLLKNNDIRAAYDSTQQYPEWTPHLTLGYPTAPAHDDKMPEYGIRTISFDRIAVWTGDFEGPEFRLEWPERDLEDGLAIAYSSMNDVRRRAGLKALAHVGVKGFNTKIEPMVDSTAAMAQSAIYGATFVDGLLHSKPTLEDLVNCTLEELVHYGVKGMRWGFRKSNTPVTPTSVDVKTTPHNRKTTKVEVQGGAGHDAHPDAVTVAVARQKMRKSGPAALSNNELKEVARRLQLESDVARLEGERRGNSFVARTLKRHGTQQLDRGINRAAGQLTDEAATRVGKAATKKVFKAGVAAAL